MLEALAFVVIIGLLPVGAHWLFSLEKPGDSRGWVVAELYLFVMVTCGQAVAEAFKDTEGIGRTLVCITGALGVLAGAGAYGILYVHPVSPDAVNVEAWLEANVVRVMLGAGAGYATYRGIGLFASARTNIARSGRSSSQEHI